MIKEFIKYYKPHKKLFAFDMFCSFLIALTDLFYPLITKNIINDYVPNRKLNLVLIWAGVVLALYLAKMGLNYFVSYWGHVVGVRMQGDMRRDMFRHLQRLPFSFFDENKTGTVMSRLINDLMDVSELAHHGPEDLFLSIIMFIGSFIALSTINLPLTVIIYCLIPFVVFFSVKMRRRMKDAFTKTREEVAEVNANVETSISGIRVSRSYTSESHENAKFDAANERFKTARGHAYKAMGQFHSVMTFFTDFLYLAALVAGGLFFYNGFADPNGAFSIDSGEFAAFILYMAMLLKPINRFISLFEQLQNGMTGFARFREIMEKNPEPEAENAVELTEVRGDIEFENVSFSYPTGDTGKNVLRDLSLKLDHGKTVALVGPSGGGKTTLCNLIPRFYEVEEGVIRIDGKDITELSRNSLRKNIGIVAQDVFLFSGTIKENIAYGDLDASDEAIIEAAKRANIHDYIMQLEKGYDTKVSERGINLSGGQKQRISIARVFLKNPPILILDEATSALDNVTEMQIQASLEELAKGRTVIVVAHRLSTIQNADEILVMTSDGIAERGNHEQLLASGGIYAGLYNRRNYM
ncbi:MAG: ABC transporter ATP-binding protein [Clostridia bacterium]|nr:ABC transporter ATP-binding protein [Clostridia bacterium]